MSRRPWLIAGVLALLVAGGLLVAVGLPALNATRDPETVPLAAEPGCDPTARACTAQGQALAVTLRLAGDPIPLEAFPVRVSLAGEAAAGVERVAVEFTMHGMDMGFNRFVLQRQGDGVWTGQAMLPVCSAGRQDWRVVVLAGARPAHRVSFGFRGGPAE